ncbi:MAG: S41 family peptidase [Lachnospiraceae bacterium]|nr:S41 family peptidase [Lachnospiraceae bacterium]
MGEKEESSKSFWKGLVTGLGVALMIVALGVMASKVIRTFQMVGIIPSGAKESVANSQTVEKLSILEDTIQKYFWKAVSEEELEEGVYKGILESLEDPYSVYYTPEELLELQQQTEGIYYGIGAYISQNTDKGYVQISKVMKNTPAEESGLLQGDYIYKVNGEDMLDKDSSYVVSKIKGEEGTKVMMTVLRETESEPLEIEVERRKIESPTVEYKMFDNGMAYIQIVEFDLVTTAQFEEAYKQACLDGMKGLIIDLRSNPGGNLSTVCDIARMLLPKGLIVYTEDKYGERVEYSCDGSQQIEVPLVVLTDGYSASASEILAGAIKDYKIGTLVGTTTYGKGIVQKVISLTDGSAVKLTVSTYYTPNGNNIHEKGVTPDVEVPFDAEQYVAGVDNQLEKAKEVLAKQMGITQ